MNAVASFLYETRAKVRMCVCGSCKLTESPVTYADLSRAAFRSSSVLPLFFKFRSCACCFFCTLDPLPISLSELLRKKDSKSTRAGTMVVLKHRPCCGWCWFQGDVGVGLLWGCCESSFTNGRRCVACLPAR